MDCRYSVTFCQFFIVPWMLRKGERWNFWKVLIVAHLFVGCSFRFKFFDSSVQTISVLKSQNNGEFYTTEEFLYSIETGVTCASMTITKVEVLNNNMEWNETQNEFRIEKASSGFYIRESNLSWVSSFCSDWKGCLLIIYSESQIILCSEPFI